MKNLKKKFSWLCLMMVAAMVLTLIPATQTQAAKKNTHSFSGVKYLLNVGKTKQLSTYFSSYDKVTWSSDNKKVATVDANGKVKAKSGGIAVITATTSYGSTEKFEIGVKSKNFYPCTGKKLKVGKDIPAGQYVVVHDPVCNSDYTYWAIYKSKKGKLITNDGFSYTSIVTLKKGQYFEFNGGYAIPFKKASKSLFNLSKISKGIGTHGTSVKVGYGFPAGTYKFTLKKGSDYGTITVRTKDNAFWHDYNNLISNESVSKSKKSVTVTVKKGQYLEIEGCTIKKVK